MRILQVTSHLNIGGITRYILALSERLIHRGHQVVIASDGGYTEQDVRQMGAAYWPLPLHTSAEFSLPVFLAVRQLAVRLKQEPVDLLHAHTRVGQVVADRISRRLGVPYVTTWHGIYRPRLSRKLWPCTGALTIAISKPVHEHLRHDFNVPEDRIRRIYNGIDADYYAAVPAPAAVEVYRRQSGIPPGRPVIGGIGRLAAGRVKGFDSLLVCAYLLQDVVPGVQVMIVGDGPRRPFLEDVAGRLGIRDRVHFVGETQDIRLPLAVMDVFVFPSRWPEAFGLTVVEAMAAGKPVVAMEVGAVPEIIRHGVDGLLVPSEDPAALAQSIAGLLRDPAAASRFGLQGQARAREIFNVDRMADEVEAVYREVVNPQLCN